MAKETYRFLLRLPPELRSRLVTAADRSGRSLNSEIVHRLDRSLDPWGAFRRRHAVPAGLRLPAVAAAAALWLGGLFAVGYEAYPRLSSSAASCAAPGAAVTPVERLAALHGCR